MVKKTKLMAKYFFPVERSKVNLAVNFLFFYHCMAKMFRQVSACLGSGNDRELPFFFSPAMV